jgi:nitroimidazol reductase NimA-like FMN-containing flavoprotein (pyridoxamine 5'-phosphate oxidase superfamily)
VPNKFEPFHIRKAEKEIIDRGEIDRVIGQSNICHLALIADGRPYVVPVTFGYGNNAIYFHSAAEGRKIRAIKNNDQVCFNIIGESQTVNEGKRCTVKYKSVTGDGVAQIVEDEVEKMLGFKLMMLHNLGKELAVPPEMLKATLVIKISILDVKGKQSGY